MIEARRWEPTWRRSELCADGACVEVMVKGDDEVLLRSSLRPTEVLSLNADEWSAFVERMVRGDFG